MSRLPPQAALWICSCLAVLAWSWFRLDQAGSRTRAAQEQFAAMNLDVQRLSELRARGQAPTRGRRPQDDLVTGVQQALATAGLPIGVFSGVQPRADQTSNGVRIQTVQLRLHGLRPAEFGAWLSAWNAQDQVWRLSELQLVHAMAPPASGMVLDTNRYDLTLVLTAPYLEDRP